MAYADPDIVIILDDGCIKSLGKSIVWETN